MRGKKVDEPSFGELLAINEDDLGSEWAEHPVRYMKVCVEAVQATARRADAELQIKIVESDLDGDLRAAVAEKKPTEEALKQSVRRDPKWRAAHHTLIAAEKEEGLLEALRRALEMRERSLKWLTQLQGITIPPEEERDAVQRASRAAGRQLAASLR